MLVLPSSVVEQIRNQLSLCEFPDSLTFADFLALLQREAFFRDVLADAQMYRCSASRLRFGDEVALVTAQQLQIIKQMQKQKGEDGAPDKIPTFSYLIDHLVLFEFKGQMHLLVAFENKSVQVFEFESGQSIYEFSFETSYLQTPSEIGAAQDKKPSSRPSTAAARLHRRASSGNHLSVQKLSSKRI